MISSSKSSSRSEVTTSILLGPFFVCFDLVNFDSRLSNQLATTGIGVAWVLVGLVGMAVSVVLLERVLVVVECSSSSNQEFFTGSGILLLLRNCSGFSPEPEEADLRPG